MPGQFQQASRYDHFKVPPDAEWRVGFCISSHARLGTMTVSFNLALIYGRFSHEYLVVYTELEGTFDVLAETSSSALLETALLQAPNQTSHINLLQHKLQRKLYEYQVDMLRGDTGRV